MVTSLELFKAYCKDFWRYRYLLQNLIARDFTLRYRRSILGVVWSVLNPLLMNLVMVLVFTTIFDTRGMGVKNFPVYLIIGQLLFGFFNEATTSALSSMLGAAPLIKKVYIPKYIFPLEKVGFAMVNCLFSFIALAIVMIATGSPLYPTALLGIYPFLTLSVFSLGVGLMLAAATVFFRDIMHLWGVFTTALMYFSAVFYDPSQMGDQVILGVTISMSKFITYNPVYWYIYGFRTAVLDGEVLPWDNVMLCGVGALVALILGLLVFRRQQDKFVLHI